MTTATAFKELTNQVFQVKPFDAPLGAELIGIDLAKPLNNYDFNLIQHAFLKHHLLVFRDQQLTPEQYIAFSKRFGPLLVHVLKQFLLANHPEIFIISNIVDKGKAIGLGDAGKFWHSDLSYNRKAQFRFYALC